MSKKIKVSLYTIADLGELKNLKSDYARAIFESLKDNISNVYCRDYKGNDPRFKKIVLGGKIIFQIIYLFKKFFHIRVDIYSVLDFFAYFKKDDANIIIFHPYSFRRTCQKFNRMGKITINIGTSATGRMISDMNKQEFLKYGFNFPQEYKADHLEKSLVSSKYIISQSEYCKSTYVKAGFKPENIFVLTGGIDTKKFKPGEKTDNVFRVLAMANCGLLKGFQYLLEAWSKMDLKRSELVLLGNPSKEMQVIFNRYKSFKNIKFIKHSDPIDFYHQSSVLVHPSLSEGSSRVIKEAMACGLSVICTENSGSIIRNGIDGFIIPIRNTEAIKEKILFFYNNQNKILEIGKEARKNIEKNGTWDNFSGKMSEIVSEIINKNLRK
ncbi:MAG: glycosyltransferase [Parcubacteria group bacterium]|jgi:glycosyltransferase involved in cell wall biosynthesis